MLETDIWNDKRLTTNPFIPLIRCTKILGLSSYDLIKQRFHKIVPLLDFCSLRYLEERSEKLMVRQNIAEPPLNSRV